MYRSMLTNTRFEPFDDLPLDEPESMPDVSGQTAEQTENERGPLKFARLLRRLGAVILLASAASFALGGLAAMDSYFRYLSFLGFTAALSGAGAFCALRLKDDKAARTFLGLATAFLPAHFSQLGALLYSHVLQPGDFVPTSFRYIGLSLPITALTIVGALILLTPIAFAGFSSLARAHARVLTGTYVLGNVLLLIPVRESNFIAGLGLVMLIGAVVVDQLYLDGRAALRNWDGRASRAMLFAPFGMLAARSLLYPQYLLFASLICTAISLALFLGLPRLLGHRPEALLSQLVGTTFAIFAWVIMTHALYFDAYSGLLYDLLGDFKSELYMPLNVLCSAAIIAALGTFSRGGGSGYRSTAAWIAIASVLMQLFAVEGIFSSLLGITVSAGIIAAAFAAEERNILYAGICGLGLALIYHLRYTVQLYDLSPWLTLAVFGALIVLASSYVEKNYRQLIDHSRQAKARIAGWN